MCHMVVLIPLAGIPLFWLLPLGYALPINVVLWLVTGVLGYKVVSAMRMPTQDGFKSLIGGEARVVSTVSPSRQYLVKVEGELWTARCAEALQPGDTVRVTDSEGIKLVVRGKSEDVEVKGNERHCH